MKEMIVRAWKDPEYRKGLTAEQRSELPENPSGRSLTELDESELSEIAGGLLPSQPRHSCIGVWCPVTELL